MEDRARPAGLCGTRPGQKRFPVGGLVQDPVNEVGPGAAGSQRDEPVFRAAMMIVNEEASALADKGHDLGQGREVARLVQVGDMDVQAGLPELLEVRNAYRPLGPRCR